MARNILIKPIVTEKSDKQMTKSSVYTFVVDRKANKVEIGKAIEEMFNVAVATVNTAVIPGKAKVRNSRSGMLRGMKPAYKKAYITLQSGESIDIFGSSDEAAE
jgi:large subunit ribosomal protein L23